MVQALLSSFFYTEIIAPKKKPSNLLKATRRLSPKRVLGF